ncbi:MAG TPA: A/G-specific adenine glycosylase [Bryobacteraceae bacterium]|nr:A/G-specific adenine glycosylase [Bryobacteraceae bacterium]
MPLDVAAIRRSLRKWYSRHKRDLPWRRTADPYRIWISEIMLQQTRVAAVIPYYERFLSLFPHPAALASASEQELLAAWAGLGYYSRARNLQKAARTIVQLPRFPADYSALLELPGVGDYTAAAVASIAFGKPHAVLDGNVLRVLSRIFAERGEIKSPPTRTRLRTFADALLDKKHPGEFNQSIMELGATICLPKQPLCGDCPIRLFCDARRQGLENQLPVSGTRPIPSRQEKQLLAIEKQGKILLWQRPPDSKRLAGFWELPEREQVPGANIYGEPGEFRHTIVNTTYLVQVYRASVASHPNGFTWLAKNNLETFPLSTISKKALARLLE